MWVRIKDLKLKAAATENKQEEQALIKAKICKELNVPANAVRQISIFRKSPDLRKKSEPLFVYSVDAEVACEIKRPKKESFTVITKNTDVYGEYIAGLWEFCQTDNKNNYDEQHPVVVGFGPAGMFAALILAELGFKPIVLERGQKVEERVKSIDKFWHRGELNTESNIQFGEGGAGTFSDGKLNSLIKDKDTVGRFVLETFVKFGAPEEILYKNKPHIGTDILRKVVKNIREYIIQKGAEIHFNTKMTEILFSEDKPGNKKVCGVKAKSIENENSTDRLGNTRTFYTDSVFLAIGHSARDTFEELKNKEITMEKKAFSVGVRIEHLQENADLWQYGPSKELMRKLNGPADYKLSCRASNGRGVYTFCMCPGGFVVDAASEQGRLVTNGMSNFDRAVKNANSAVLVSITPEDFPGNNILSGVEFQRKIEEAAFYLGGSTWKAPCQLFGDFKENRVSKSLGKVEPTFSNGYTLSDLNEILPMEVGKALKEGISSFGQMIKGFDSYDAVLTGCETRSSSPVRILRDESGCSVSMKGLYPSGEGAGYAGGILSAATDGIKTVEKWLNRL